MIQGKTSSGYEFTIDEKAADNMELIDALAELEDGNELAVSKVCRLLFGPAERKRIYDYLRDEEGRVPIQSFIELVKEIFTSKNELKN